MSDNGRLTERQQRVIPYLLASPSTEEACRRARINKTTVYEWLRDETFRHELKRRRDAVIERAHLPKAPLPITPASLAETAETSLSPSDFSLPLPPLPANTVAAPP
jgi:hypothetical protein